VFGIDMDAALGVAAARGFGLAVLSELLPIGESGIVQGLNSNIYRSVEATER
jgi:hypothetical protein